MPASPGAPELIRNNCCFWKMKLGTQRIGEQQAVEVWTVYLFVPYGYFSTWIYYLVLGQRLVIIIPYVYSILGSFKYLSISTLSCETLKYMSLYYWLHLTNREIEIKVFYIFSMSKYWRPDSNTRFQTLVPSSFHDTTWLPRKQEGKGDQKVKWFPSEENSQNQFGRILSVN